MTTQSGISGLDWSPSAAFADLTETPAARTPGQPSN